MRNRVWQRAIEGSADPQRAKQGIDQLIATSAAAHLKKDSAEQARILAALFSGSQALGELLFKHSDWLLPALDVQRLQHPRREQGLRRELSAWLRPSLAARDYPAALVKVRQFKQREMLRIAARDLARLADFTEITREISSEIGRASCRERV